MKYKLRCGVARADITPGQNLIGGLYGLAGLKYTGIIDHIYLRVIALSDGENSALVISFDLDKAPKPVKWLSKISEHTGIPIENISYIGTHTHSAPVTTYRPGESKSRSIDNYIESTMPEYEEMVYEKLISKIDEALGNMQPAKVGFAKGESYINVNRSATFNYEAEDGTIHPYISQGPNNTAPVDRTVFVMKIDDENGNPVAFFVNYAVHCCTMFLNRYDEEGNMGISGDIAGSVSRYIEDKFPGSVAIWSSGAAGDVNPIIANEVFYANPKDGARKTYLFPNHDVINALMISLAARHFEDIMETIRKIDNSTSDVKIKGIIEWSETDAYNIQEPSKGVYEIIGDRDKPYRIRMHLLCIGNVALFGVGGELFSSLARIIHNSSPLCNLVVINHEASLIEDAGYILDDETLKKIRKKTPVMGFLPGRNSAAKPGQVADSLKKHTESMFLKVLG